MTEHRTPDPQWDFALAIRTALELHGHFEAEVDERDAQAVVDLHWAARQAGRLLGVRVKVELGAPVGAVDYIVSATVVLVDDDGAGRARAERGLELLVRSVQRAQSLERARRVARPDRRRPQRASRD